MAGAEKIIKKMKNQPRSIKYEEAKKVLEHYGYQHVRTKGSHHQFRNNKGDVTTVKYINPLKISYVTDILAIPPLAIYYERKRFEILHEFAI